MPRSLNWQQEGSGENLVLLHGWGMNGAVWQQALSILSLHFTVYTVDLPGYGHSSKVAAEDLDQMVDLLMATAPSKAVWLGWSLGGLVATQAALRYPQRVQKLITVASSPKFAAERPWRGIKSEVLDAFTEQLLQDFQLTIDRFMALQAMGSPSARQDAKKVKQSVLSRPLPDQNALLLGLQMLKNIDLREQLPELTMPILRLYGRLDGLVPIKVADEVTKLLPSSLSFTFTESSHAPFITECELFCQRLVQFINE